MPPSISPLFTHIHTLTLGLQILLRENNQENGLIGQWVIFWRITDYVMLCEDVFRQITLSKGEAVLYVPATQSDFMGFLPEHPLLNWDVAGLKPPFCSTNTNTQTHPVLHSLGSGVYS